MNAAFVRVNVRLATRSDGSGRLAAAVRAWCHRNDGTVFEEEGEPRVMASNLQVDETGADVGLRSLFRQQAWPGAPQTRLEFTADLDAVAEAVRTTPQEEEAQCA